MKKNQEINNQMTKIVVKEMIKKDKKNQIQFLFRGLKKKSKKLNHYSYKEKFK